MFSMLSLVLLNLLWTSFSNALPAIKASAIDDELLFTFNLMEQYASAAYCKSNFNSPGDQIKCKSGNCPFVEASNATSALEYSSTTLTGVTGYVALDPTHNLIVVAFRGSASIQNWVANLDIAATTTTLCSGCTAHSGFWKSWLDARKDVTGAIEKLSSANPSYKIVVTGHSLGGAIATIAAAELRNSGYTVTMYSFGAPRIANSKLSDYITKQPGGNYRITHFNDPVPNVPPIIMDFAHVSPEYYINKKNNDHVGVGDIQIFEGGKNLKGNAAWLVTDILAHLWYFNGISKCVF